MLSNNKNIYVSWIIIKISNNIQLFYLITVSNKQKTHFYPFYSNFLSLDIFLINSCLVFIRYNRFILFTITLLI
jgi:hypothetical protein